MLDAYEIVRFLLSVRKMVGSFQALKGINQDWMISWLKIASLAKIRDAMGQGITGFINRVLSEKMRIPWHFFAFGGTVKNLLNFLCLGLF